MKQHFQLLANYNHWMNDKVYNVTGQLSPVELAQDRGAFFGSILATLNHIVVGDTLWLQRFARHPAATETLRLVSEQPAPVALNQILFEDFAALKQYRAWLDKQIILWIETLGDPDLEDLLTYHSMRGVEARKLYGSLILHFFNHQTHHRGQVATLLTQAGLELDDTDLLLLIPDQPPY
nr:DinB family protein [uncultured Desulfuromonas sp.]